MDANQIERRLDELLRRLERVESRLGVVVFSRVGPGTWSDVVTIEPEPPPAEPVLAAPAETTWIEIELVDEADEPVPGRRYQITLPDGTLREGKLNSRGLARINDIEAAGACQISFPDLDADAWEPL